VDSSRSICPITRVLEFRVKKGLFRAPAIFSKQEPLSSSTAFRSSLQKRFSFADELQRDQSRGRPVMTRIPEITSCGLYAERQGRSQPSALRFKHWDPAFLAMAKQLEKTSRSFFAATSMWRIPSSIWPTPSRIAAKGFHG